MIQQQTMLDIADNTGAKQAMCIKVLRGSSSKGKFKRKIANVGDVIICAVKKVIPSGEIKNGEIIRCVVVRTRQPTLRPDGSYVRFDRNAAWLRAHAAEVYPKYRGKCICIAGEELFVADTPEEAFALAKAAHPDDDGRLPRVWHGRRF